MLFFFSPYLHLRHIHSFPTRRSSDLQYRPRDGGGPAGAPGFTSGPKVAHFDRVEWLTLDSFSADRKSTRLNSSHVAISYAVFCLKKKKNSDKRRLCARSTRGGARTSD